MTVANWRLQKWQDPRNQTLLEAWARRGMTQAEIAQRMGVAQKTLQRWLREYAFIREPIQTGKEYIDAQVENALLKRALGCVVTEKKYGIPTVRAEEPEDAEEERGPVLLAVTEKEIPPDPRSAMFWLTNRMPETWKAKIDEPEKTTEPIQIVIKTPEEGKHHDAAAAANA